jgi:hypothetical protein
MTDNPDLPYDGPEPSWHLSAMDDSVAAINTVIDGTNIYNFEPAQLVSMVEANVSHLETMTVDRIGELGESPDLSSYETAITAGRAYLESA